MDIFSLDVIDYVYQLYETTLHEQKSINTLFQEMEEKLGILHPRFLMMSNSMLNIMGYTFTPSIYVIGIMGILKSNPSTAIIAFRGTKNLSEWMKNVDFLYQTPLSGKISSKIKLARGFSSLYHSTPPGPSYSIGCHCQEPCHDILSSYPKYSPMNPFGRVIAQRLLKDKKTGCATYPEGSYSKIGSSCPTSFLTIDCDSHSLSPPLSLHDQVKKYAKEMMETYKVQRFIICGHSLGSVFAQLAALDLVTTIPKKTILKTLYTFASPRIGNSEFVRYFNECIPLSKNKRFANIEDTVVNLPLPYNVFACYAHTGSTRQTFSNISILEGECGKRQIKDIHSVSTYRSFLLLSKKSHINKSKQNTT